MKTMALKTLRDALRHKGQFVGLIVVVMLGIATFVAFLAAYNDLNRSITRAETELRFADFSIRVLEAPAGETDVIRRVPGVQAAEGRLVLETGLDLADGTKSTARLIGIPSDRPLAANKLVLEKGRLPDPNARGEALLHAKFAKDAGVSPGDSLVLRLGQRREEVRVVGIVSSPEYMYPVRAKGDMPSPREFAIIYLDHGDIERLFGRTDAINDIAVVVKPGYSAVAVASQVKEALKHYGASDPVMRADQPSAFMLGEEIKQLRTMAVFLPLIILFISAVSMFITLSRLVTAQRGEIGLAKALGYGDGQLFAHYLLFSAMIAIAGAVLGVLLGDLLARLMAQQYVDMLGVPLLQHGYYPLVIAGAFAVSLVSCLLAGLFPAWRAVRLPPAEAMHADPNTALSGGRVPIVERVLSPVLPRSFTLRIPIRNVFRSKRRSLYTVVGVAFALIIVVATQSSFDSVDELLQTIPREAMRWDLTAGFEEPIPASTIAEIGTWKGVTSAEGARAIPATLMFNGRRNEGEVTAISAGASFHGFDIAQGDSVSIALANDGLILPVSLAKKLGVGVGDTLRVKTPYLDDSRPVRVASISRETLGTPVFVGTKTGRELTSDSSDRFNMVYVRAERSATKRVKDDLSDLPGSTTVVVKTDMMSRIQEMMKFAYFYQALLFGFGVAMAFVVVYNTLTANVSERAREIATMRTIGESNARLAVMLTVENLLLAIAGIPLGLWLGLQTTNALYSSLASEAYTVTATIKPESVALIALGVVAVMLLSEIQPIRKVFRLDLAQATKIVE